MAHGRLPTAIGPGAIAIGIALLAAVGCGRGESGGATRAEHGATVAGQSGLGPAMRSEAAPIVILRTSLGSIKLRLDAEKAPITVDNFLSQVENGYFDQTIFHQVEPGYVVLGGTYRANLSAKPRPYTIHNESAHGLRNRRGTIAMSRALDGVDSSTTEFFINLDDNPALDYRGPGPADVGYCAFGEVIEGMDVVERIAQVPTQKSGDLDRLPIETVLIDSARRPR